MISQQWTTHKGQEFTITSLSMWNTLPKRLQSSWTPPHPDHRCPHLYHPPNFTLMPFLPQPSQFILAWDRHQMCRIADLEAWLQIKGHKTVVVKYSKWEWQELHLTTKIHENKLKVMTPSYQSYVIIMSYIPYNEISHGTGPVQCLPLLSKYFPHHHTMFPYTETSPLHHIISTNTEMHLGWKEITLSNAIFKLYKSVPIKNIWWWPPELIICSLVSTKSSAMVEKLCNALVSIEKSLLLMNDLDTHPRSSQLLLLNGHTAYDFLFVDCCFNSSSRTVYKTLELLKWTWLLVTLRTPLFLTTSLNYKPCVLSNWCVNIS